MALYLWQAAPADVSLSRALACPVPGHFPGPSLTL